MLLEVGLDVLQAIQSTHFGGFLGRSGLIGRATLGMTGGGRSGGLAVLSRQTALALVIHLPLGRGWVSRVLGGTLSERATFFNLAVLTSSAIEAFCLTMPELVERKHLPFVTIAFVCHAVTVVEGVIILI